MNDWFEIFSEGVHTDNAGNTREWSAEDLSRIAASYDPAEYEAPIVVGHPATDAPAYGWVEALRHEGGRLLAKAGQVMPEFARLVREGRYKKVSIKLDAADRLRHIGFLGGAAPAVEGLASVQFVSGDEGAVFEQDLLPAAEPVSEAPLQLPARVPGAQLFSKEASEAKVMLARACEQGKLTPAQRIKAERFIDALPSLSGAGEFSAASGNEDGSALFAGAFGGAVQLFGEFLSSMPKQPLFTEVIRKPAESAPRRASILEYAGELIRSHSIFS